MNFEKAEILDNQPRRVFRARVDPFIFLSDHHIIREYRHSKGMVDETNEDFRSKYLLRQGVL